MLKQFIKSVYYKLASSVFTRFPNPLSYQLPGTLVIEPTNKCMLKCRVCATVNNPIRLKGEMSVELFEHILSQIDWRVKRINFSYAGEPLLNKNIFKMVKMAREKGIPSIIETNGMLLDKNIDELLDSGLMKLMVAFDGISQNSVSRYRDGIDLTTVIKGVKNLVAKRRKLGLISPQIHLLFIVMKHNEGEMKEAIKLAEEIGVDFIDFKSLILSGGIWLNELERNKFALDFLPVNERYKRYQLKNGTWVLKNNLSGDCPYVFSGSVIMWNGDVTVCTMDVNGQFIVGNVKEESFRDIWKGNRYTELRKKILKRELKECRECAYLVDHYDTIKVNKNTEAKGKTCVE